MRLINIIKKIFLSLVFASFIITASVSGKEDEKINAITDQIQIIAQDLKTLEKAVYKKSDITGSVSSNNLNEDVLTKHLLKLNEIEEQFRNITNKF